MKNRAKIEHLKAEIIKLQIERKNLVKTFESAETLEQLKVIDSEIASKQRKITKMLDNLESLINF